VEAQGFKAFSRQGIGLTANENVRVDARLELGALAESVSVTSEAPLVDSRSSMMGTLIDSRRVTELPIARVPTATCCCSTGRTSRPSSGTPG